MANKEYAMRKCLTSEAVKDFVFFLVGPGVVMIIGMAFLFQLPMH
jgi:hypothetical protein